MQAYIDNSKDDSRVLVYGGLIASADQWDSFSKAWRQCLDDAPWDVFKMKEVSHRCRGKRLEHAIQHYQAMCAHVLGGFCFVVPIEPLKKWAAHYGLAGTPVAKPYFWASAPVLRQRLRTRRMARNVSMEIPARRGEPDARWLRCDLHVHTPFDKEKKSGEDISGAIAALKKAKTERLAQIADRFVQGCRNAANGERMDLVALTDHNSIDGYRYLRPYFEALQVQSRDQGLQMPAILPGVEFSVGAERAIHFLVIFAADTNPDDIARAIAHVFATSDPFDPKLRTPRATGPSVINFLDKLYEYCRPSPNGRSTGVVILHHSASHGPSRRTSPSAHLLKIPTVERDRHRSNDNVADPEASRSQRQELQRRDSPGRQASSHHSRTKAPWVDGKSPDLKDTGGERRNVGDRLRSIRMRCGEAGQPDVERYIIRPRVGEGTIAKPMTGHPHGVSGPAGDTR